MSALMTPANLARLASSAFDGIFIHDHERIVDTDARFAALFGYDSGEIIGLPLDALIEPGVTGSTLSGVRRDGRRLAIEVTALDLSDPSTQPRAIAGVRAVTSARKPDCSFQLACDHDLDGNILYVNMAAANALEFGIDELCAMNLHDVVVPGARANVDSYLNEVRDDGIAKGLMYVRTRSGAMRVWQYENVLHSNGERPIVRGLARDVTEREEALHKVRESERRFRTIIENASDLVGIIGPDGRLRYHSPSAEHLLGPGIAGQPIAELVHPDDLARTSEFFEAQNHAGAPTRTIDFRVRSRDGSWRCLSVVATTVAHRGAVTSIIINARDITDRLLLEGQLEQAHRVNGLGKLAATVAHEFNNVLMGIQPFADLMRKPGVDGATIAKGAHHIANSIARGKRVAKDILRFTHPAQPALQPLQLSEWWKRLAPEMEATVGNSIELTSSFPPSLGVIADATQLSQVFSNLISNARDAMPHGGTLRVSARRPEAGETFPFGVISQPEQYVHISVADSGIGMTENVLRHAFDPLFTTKQNGGTGLGLAVAHQAITSHRGQIFAESVPSRGTTFHIFLPAANPVPVGPGCGPKPDAEPGLSMKRVLIVDDEPSIIEGMAELLRGSNLIVDEATTGQLAIEQVQKYRPDLAIVDIRLPDIDGRELAERLRETCPGLKIIFASGHGVTQTVPVREGETMFLPKPFEWTELVDAMARLDVSAS